MIRQFWTGLLFVGFGCLGPAATAGAGNSPDPQSWVLKVEAQRADGVEIGSAIPVARERVVTNCHVLRWATEIKVEQGGYVWNAVPDVRDGYRDLCVLRVPGFAGYVPPFADPAEVHVGMPVRAIGFSQGHLVVSEGSVHGLHAVTPTGRVIQTSASFDPGASGGGLFDVDGHLVGILAFKSKAGGSFHFALPVAWVSDLERKPREREDGKPAFWEESTGEYFFLRACALEAKNNWRALDTLAREWVRAEPANPEAWMGLGRAHVALGRRGDAVTAFRRALALDGTHIDARRELERTKM